MLNKNNNIEVMWKKIKQNTHFKQFTSMGTIVIIVKLKTEQYWMY